MQPPPPVDFVSMDRLQQLYSELPALFAKDIARRQHLQQQQQLMNAMSAPAGGSTKRDRPEDMTAEITSKRRDTGDAKSMTLGSSASPAAASPQPNLNLPQSPHLSQSHSRSSISVPSAGSPSMPPPSAPTPSAFDAQANAARERSRSMQMGTPGQPGQINRQISPSNAQRPIQSTAGPSSGSHSAAVMASVAQMGPAAMQAYQVLQTPSHPIMQYLLHNIPNFMSAALPHQLQQIRAAMQQVRSQINVETRI